VILLVFVLTAKENTEHTEEKRFDRLSVLSRNSWRGAEIRPF